jgi:hypothetical protein
MDIRRATESPADILDSTSRGPTERNAADMPGSAAAIESPREMRARSFIFRKTLVNELKSPRYPPRLVSASMDGFFFEVNVCE